MDPQACLDELLALRVQDDPEAVIDGAFNLLEWLLKGGAVPKITPAGIRNLRRKSCQLQESHCNSYRSECE